ncbi:MAG TPA: SpoIVB peptidase [Ruminococcaceae bacterium]|nr:SpoIVB peptidase [Oscillospiraceae bacterium]
MLILPFINDKAQGILIKQALTSTFAPASAPIREKELRILRKYKNFFRVLSVSLFTLTIPLFGAIGYLGRALPDFYHGGDLTLFSIASRPYIQADETSTAYGGAQVSSAKSNAVLLNLELFGFVPIKTVTVQQADTVMLAPCGTPFGIKMFTDGVLVVGMSNLETDMGSANPAKDAGLEIGDILCTLDGQKVTSNEDVSRIVSSSGGRQIACTYRRDGEYRSTFLTPLQSRAGTTYRIGIWVRDSTAGIGTLTYCNISKKTFAGLGHGVCDVDTGKLMPLMSGEIVDVSINEIVKGKPGSPGELRGIFLEDSLLGELTDNCETGVFGDLQADCSGLSEIPAAFSQEVMEGPAQILTTISGNTPQHFDIVIDKVSFSQSNLSKNLVIRITDPVLLEKTGGIIQGMSGSPIIQNGKLVGAVTHVLVNDPTRGYGIFIENMLDAAE